MQAVRHGADDAPAVLIAHGFKGFKDWGMFPWMADQLASAGLQAIRFDFSHNGVEKTDFDRLDLFLLDTTTRHQEDLRALADGGDAILFGADEPRVGAIATLASVSSTVSAPADLEDQLRTAGFYAYPNARTKQLMPVSRHAFDDGVRHSIPDAATALRCPLLLVHGDADEAVPQSAQATLAQAQPAAEVLTVTGAGHTFGAVHPFQGPTPALDEALAAITAFFQEHLL